jgi:hypothetical protein
MKNLLAFGTLLGVASLASAQVSTINSARIYRQFTDDTTSNYSFTNSYPGTIELSDLSVDTNSPGTFANRDNWDFSADGGTTSYAFSNNDFFSVSMDVTLSLPSGSSVSPRKEAGFLLSTAGGQGQFIVNTDAHEIVAFGGPLPFYSFNVNNGLSYNAGDTVRLGMRYYLDTGDGMRKVIYSVNGIQSAPQTFTNLEQGIIDGSTLGGYLQVPISNGHGDNGGDAVFGKVSIAAVPEPTSVAALGIGVIALARRRRRA